MFYNGCGGKSLLNVLNCLNASVNHLYDVITWELNFFSLQGHLLFIQHEALTVILLSEKEKLWCIKSPGKASFLFRGS